jgi:hypothetical protein
MEEKMPDPAARFMYPDSPGEGFRFLLNGETVLQSDDWWNGEKWIATPVWGPMKKIGADDFDYSQRRALEKEL